MVKVLPSLQHLNHGNIHFPKSDTPPVIIRKSSTQSQSPSLSKMLTIKDSFLSETETKIVGNKLKTAHSNIANTLRDTLGNIKDRASFSNSNSFERQYSSFIFEDGDDVCDNNFNENGEDEKNSVCRFESLLSDIKAERERMIDDTERNVFDFMWGYEEEYYIYIFNLFF